MSEKCHRCGADTPSPLWCLACGYVREVELSRRQAMAPRAAAAGAVSRRQRRAALLAAEEPLGKPWVPVGDRVLVIDVERIRELYRRLP